MLGIISNSFTNEVVVDQTASRLIWHYPVCARNFFAVFRAITVDADKHPINKRLRIVLLATSCSLQAGKNILNK